MGAAEIYRALPWSTYQMAFAVGAGLMIIEVMVTALVIPRRDVAAIQAAEAPAVSGV
jgi:hypothetical protein